MSLFTTLLSKVSRELLSINMRSSKYKPFSHFKTFTSTGETNNATPGLDVKVTSIDMIKPSSPTARCANTVKLSMVDQFAPFTYMPIILFYKNDNPSKPVDHIERSTTFKKSLSETLVKFYPLAGRIQDNISINCDDHGVDFYDTQVSDDLTKVIEHPNIEELKALLPVQDRVVLQPNHKNGVLSVQINHFSCGGTAIGLRISHKIADAVATTSFLKAWANTTRGLTLEPSLTPEFNAASLFPPMEELNHIFPGQDTTIDHGKFESKRLIFDKSKINELKTQARAGSWTKNPTRVEVVTAFIWKQMMAANTKFKVKTAIHAVNFRSRMLPIIPDSCLGNLTCTTSTSALPNGPKTEYTELVYSVRKAIDKIDDNYLSPMLKGDQRMAEISKESENFEFGLDKCFFTSLCRFPLNEVNFGMGEPVWACFPAFHATNMVVLSSTKCGEGVEAWIHMPKDYINVLDFDLS